MHDGSPLVHRFFITGKPRASLADLLDYNLFDNDYDHNY